MTGKKLFFHRLFRNHTWKTVDEKYIKGLPIEQTGITVTGFMAEATIERLREGYWIVQQECIICGDRRTLKK